MDITTLKTGIAYESKLVRRSWLFYLFIFTFLICFSIVFTKLDTNWGNSALASSIPLQNVHILNFIQSLFVAFIICDITRKRKKAETRETLTTRPIGNDQSTLSEFLGIIIPFFTLDIIFTLLFIIYNLVAPYSPLNIGTHLFYLFTHILPTLVFVTGLSLLITKIFKHTFINWLVLMITLYLLISYGTKPLYGILDFRGFVLPTTFSTITGYLFLKNYLLQRIIFLILGISFTYFSILTIKRVPGTPARKKVIALTGSLFLLLSIALSFVYVQQFQTRQANRSEYRETFLKYIKHPKARILTHDITYIPEGNKFLATSKMVIKNTRKEKIKQLLLFLNPGLQVHQITSQEKNIPFHREHQTILIEHALASQEQIELEIKYGGYIDEDIFMTHIADEKYFTPGKTYFMRFPLNYGKRTAFVSDQFTLLMPEILWYPTAVTPQGLQAADDINFTAYTLHVKTPENTIVLSQGTPETKGEYTSFRNLQNISGLTLCFGAYEKRAITVDSLTVEYYTYPGNDFYLHYFDEWDELKKENPNRNQKLIEIFKSCKKNIEDKHINSYPYRYLKIIEVPSATLFQSTRTSCNTIQPEMLLFSERLCHIEYSNPGKITGDPEFEQTAQDVMLEYKIPFYFNQSQFKHIFTNSITSITSEKYSGIDLILKYLMKPELTHEYLTPEIIAHFQEKGLREIMKEKPSQQQHKILTAKISNLLGFLSTLTTTDSLDQFIQNFNKHTQFNEVDFDEFILAFKQHFNYDLTAYFDDWYFNKDLPQLAIKNITQKTNDDLKVIEFDVTNSGKKEGIVSLVKHELGHGSNEKLIYIHNYIIKPEEYKHIVIHADIDDELSLTTNFSETFPDRISMFDENYTRAMEENPIVSPIPTAGITTLTKAQFQPQNEIIIDNEDENFHLLDSANNRKRLTDLLKKENDQKYTTLRGTKANAWILSLSQLFNGDHIHSAFIKAVGSGQFKAEWVANLPQAGKYEIFIYRPHMQIFGNELYVSDQEGMKNYYTVNTPNGQEEIVLDVQENDDEWVSLGVFTLPAGASSVQLDDRGVQSIKGRLGDYVQLIVADAVKWVKK